MQDELVDKYRGRLADISWFMRVLNEDIARRANKEDNCTGRFWEGRFKSQALLDEAALAACLTYVDLNPIRAKIAATPETSDYTSIKKRFDHAQLGNQPKSLLRFAGSPRKHMPKGLPFELKSYIELVELTGQCIRADKRGYINETQPILTRLNIEPENWIKLTTQFSRVFHGAVGRERTITAYCETLQKRRRTNLTNCERLLA
ncbi:transposase [Pseudoalteromonas piscicida]|uniref:Transposase n=3 Tax=Pseudoalteromonas TaxID=53246 RepID=A0AAQ2IQ80_PSEO7|nr:transposase [Pseudoalteromonas piscicida]